jgi:PAS domain S-box-containing protein
MDQADTRKQFRKNLTALQKHVAKLADRSERTERAEAELARFFAQSLDLLCIAGFDGHFKRLNPAWMATLGWTLEELEGRPFIDFVHPDDRDATLEEFKKLAGGASTILFENRYRHKDGSFRWLRWNARPGPGRKEIYATARDVTDQRRLEREVLEAVDRERERLGRDLHDGLCQNLAGIAALSSTLAKKLAAHSESEASAAAAEISQLLNETIGHTRDLARGLAHGGLNDSGLDGALEDLAVNTRHLFGVSCHLDRDRPFVKLRHEVVAHLFRIAQEAVNNAVTHARACRIDISLSCKYGKGLLRIWDDGVGLRDAPKNPDGIGLQTMAYRARLIGGSLDVRRRTRNGTAVTCVFPLHETTGTREETDHVRRNT